MIEQIFGSKTRVKLLSLFLNNPDRPYFVREITRRIDEQINSVRRELGNLLSIGIIKSESSQNKLYYEVNQNYEHYQSLRAIFAGVKVKTKTVMKETKEEDDIAKQLRTTGHVELAFLTGAFVNQPHIGIDIFLVGDLNRAKVTKVVAELEREAGHELNYTVMTSEDYSYRLGLNDRFLNTITQAKKIKLIDSADEPLAHTGISLGDDETPVDINVEED